MAKEEVEGTELKRRFATFNAHRILDGQQPILQKDLAETFKVSPVTISNAFAGVRGLERLRSRIAAYFSTQKPQPNRMYAGKMKTR